MNFPYKQRNNPVYTQQQQRQGLSYSQKSSIDPSRQQSSLSKQSVSLPFKMINSQMKMAQTVTSSKGPGPVKGKEDNPYYSGRTVDKQAFYRSNRSHHQASTPMGAHSTNENHRVEALKIEGAQRIKNYNSHAENLKRINQPSEDQESLVDIDEDNDEGSDPEAKFNETQLAKGPPGKDGSYFYVVQQKPWIKKRFVRNGRIQSAVPQSRHYFQNRAQSGYSNKMKHSDNTSFYRADQQPSIKTQVKRLSPERPSSSAFPTDVEASRDFLLNKGAINSIGASTTSPFYPLTGDVHRKKLKRIYAPIKKINRNYLSKNLSNKSEVIPGARDRSGDGQESSLTPIQQTDVFLAGYNDSGSLGERSKSNKRSKSGSKKRVDPHDDRQSWIKSTAARLKSAKTNFSSLKQQISDRDFLELEKINELKQENIRLKTELKMAKKESAQNEIIIQNLLHPKKSKSEFKRELVKLPIDALMTQCLVLFEEQAASQKLLTRNKAAKLDLEELVKDLNKQIYFLRRNISLTDTAELQTEISYLTVHSQQQDEVIAELKQFIRENPPGLTQEDQSLLDRSKLLESHVKDYEIIFKKQDAKIQELQEQMSKEKEMTFEAVQEAHHAQERASKAEQALEASKPASIMSEPAMAEKDAEIFQLKMSLEEMQHQVESLHLETSDLQNRVDQLTADNQELLQEKEAFGNERNEFSRQLDALKTEKEKALKQIESLQRPSQKLSGRSLNQASISSKQESALSQTKKRPQEPIVEISKDEPRKTTAFSQGESTKRESDLKTQIEERDRVIMELRSKIGDSNTRAQGQAAELEAKLSSLTQENQDLKTQIVTETTRLKDQAEKDIMELKQQLEAEKSKESSSNVALVSLSKARGEVKELSEALGQDQSMSSKLEMSRMSDLEQKEKSFHAEIEKKVTLIREMSLKISHLENQIQEKSTMVDMYKRQASAIGPSSNVPRSSITTNEEHKGRPNQLSSIDKTGENWQGTTIDMEQMDLIKEDKQDQVRIITESKMSSIEQSVASSKEVPTEEHKQQPKQASTISPRPTSGEVEIKQQNTMVVNDATDLKKVSIASSKREEPSEVRTAVHRQDAPADPGISKELSQTSLELSSKKVPKVTQIIVDNAEPSVVSFRDESATKPPALSSANEADESKATILDPIDLLRDEKKMLRKQRTTNSGQFDDLIAKQQQEVKELEVTVQKLTEVNEALQARITELDKGLSGAQGKLEKKIKEVASLTSEKHRLSDDLDLAQKTVQRLKEQRRSPQKSNTDELEAALEESQHLMKMAQRRSDEKTKLYKEGQEQLDLLKKQQAEMLEEKVQEAKVKIEEAFAQQIEDAEAQKAKVEEEMTVLKEQLIAARFDLEEAQAQIPSQTETKEEASQTEELAEEPPKEDEAVVQLRNDLSASQSEATERKIRLSELEGALNEALSSKGDLDKQVKTLKQSERSLKLKTEDLEAQLEETITMYVEMQATTIEQKQDLIARDQAVEAASKEVAALKKENLEQKNELEQAIADLSEAAKELEKYEAKLASKEDDEAPVEFTLAEIQPKGSSLPSSRAIPAEEELASLKQDLELAEKELKKSKLDISQVKQDLKSAEQELKEAQQAIDKVNEQAKKDQKQAAQDLRKAKQEASKFEGELEEVKGELKSLEDKLTKVEEDLRQTAEEKDKANNLAAENEGKFEQAAKDLKVAERHLAAARESEDKLQFQLEQSKKHLEACEKDIEASKDDLSNTEKQLRKTEKQLELSKMDEKEVQKLKGQSFEKVDELEEQLSEKVIEIEKLQGKVTSTTEALEEEKATSGKLAEEMKSLKEKLDEAQDQNEESALKLEKMTKKLTDQTEAASKIADKLEEAEKYLKSKEEELKEAKSALKKAEDRSTAQEQDIAVLTEEKEAAEKDLKAKSADLEKQQDAVKKLKEEADELQEEKEKLTEQIKETEKKMAQQAKEAKEAKQEQEASLKSLTAATKSLEDADNKLKRLHELEEREEQRAKEAEEAKEAQKAKENQEAMEAEEFKKKEEASLKKAEGLPSPSTLKAELEKEKKAKEGLIADLESVNLQLEESKTKLALASKNLKAAQEKEEASKATAEEQAKALKEAQDQLTTSEKKKLEQLDKELKGAKDHLTQAQEQLKEIPKLREDMDLKKKELAALEKEKDALHKEKSTLKENQDKVQKEKEQAVDKLKEAESAAAEHLKKITDLEEALDAKVQDVSELEEKIADLSSALQREKESKAKLNEDFKQMQEENSKLIAEFGEFEKVLSEEKDHQLKLKLQTKARESKEFRAGVSQEYNGAIEAALHELTEIELDQKYGQLEAAKKTSSSLKEQLEERDQQLADLNQTLQRREEELEKLKEATMPLVSVERHAQTFGRSQTPDLEQKMMADAARDSSRNQNLKSIQDSDFPSLTPVQVQDSPEIKGSHLRQSSKISKVESKTKTINSGAVVEYEGIPIKTVSFSEGSFEQRQHLVQAVEASIDELEKKLVKADSEKDQMYAANQLKVFKTISVLLEQLESIKLEAHGVKESDGLLNDKILNILGMVTGSEHEVKNIIESIHSKERESSFNQTRKVSQDGEGGHPSQFMLRSTEDFKKHKKTMSSGEALPVYKSLDAGQVSVDDKAISVQKSLPFKPNNAPPIELKIKYEEEKKRELPQKPIELKINYKEETPKKVEVPPPRPQPPIELKIKYQEEAPKAVEAPPAKPQPPIELKIKYQEEPQKQPVEAPVPVKPQQPLELKIKYQEEIPVIPPPRPSAPITLNIKYSEESDRRQVESDRQQVDSLKSKIHNQEDALKSAQEEAELSQKLLASQKQETEDKLSEIAKLKQDLDLSKQQLENVYRNSKAQQKQLKIENRKLRSQMGQEVISEINENPYESSYTEKELKDEGEDRVEAYYDEEEEAQGEYYYEYEDEEDPDKSTGSIREKASPKKEMLQTFDPNAEPLANIVVANTGQL